MSPWMRRHATTLALSVLALGGALVLLVVDRGSVTTDEAEARRKNLLEVFRRDDVSELSIQAKGKSARVFRDSGAPGQAAQGPWLVESAGQRYAADEAAVDQALGSLELAVVERRVPKDSVDRAALGLSEPRASLTLAMGGRPVKVTLGGAAPSPEGAVYAEVEGRGVFVITAQLAAALDVDPDRLRAKSMNPYSTAELRTLQIEGKGGSRRFERAPWGGSPVPAFRWDGSTKEGKTRASAPAIARALGALGELDAEVFLSNEEAERALSKEISIRMISDFADSTDAQIDVGGACPGHAGLVVAVRRSPSALSACVESSLLDRLAEPAEAFVDQALFAAPIDAVVEVRLTSGDQTMEIARKGSAFRMRAPQDRDVEAALGRGLLESLLKLEGGLGNEGPPPSLTSLGLDKPRATVRLTSTTEARTVDGGVADERVEVVEVGSLDGDVVHVRRAEDGALLDVDAARAEALFPREIALRSLEVVNEPARRFVSLEVSSAGRRQRVRRGDGGESAADGWQMVEPKGAGLESDASLVNDLAERLGALRAARWVKPAADDAAFGLSSPRITIEAALEDEDGDPDAGAARRTLKLFLGSASTDGSFARLDGDSAVFIAPKEVEQAADRWLVDRSLLRVDASSLMRVTLAAKGGSKVEMDRSGDAFRVVSGGDRASGAKASEQAAAIRDALADFVAEEAASVGEPRALEGLKDPILTMTIVRAPSSSEGGAPPGRGSPKPLRVAVGAGDVWRGTRIYYVRGSDVEATFAVAQSKVKPLLDAAGAR